MMLNRLLLLSLCLAPVLPAGLLRIELSERSDVLGGKSFGAAGPYERLIGKAYFGVDPKLPANKIICDIDKAPRNDSGLVEFSSDIYVLKPRDPKNGNGAVIYEVSNRGRKGMLAMYNRGGSATDPRTAADFGDNFLLERGYTLVWLGWQFDVPRTEGLMRLYTPIARNGDRPIPGLVRSEIIVDKKEFSHSLADRNHVPYPPADPDDPKLTLTVRDHGDSPRRAIPRSAWKIVEGTHLALDAGFEPGRIYELVYGAKDPALVGLGPAAIRDMISYLKNGNGNNVLPLADQRRFIKRAYAVGTSQSGRFLRTFLYFGFNGDEKGGIVFDGVMPHVAGAGRGSFNIRFGQPSRDGHPFMNLLYPTDIFPFTDVSQTDPETGISDGILARVEHAKVAPKIFYTNSSYEYWGRAAALIHTLIDGKKDAPIPANTRIYFFAGGQHGPAAYPPVRAATQNLPNPNPYTWSMRALLVAMDNWVAKNVEPPPSQYPKIAAGKLVPINELQFPKIPSVAVPARVQRAYRVDYGPEFRSMGIVSIEPPRVGKAFPALLPQVDSDGNETSGIRMPDIQAPLGTYAGWNLRSPEIGAPDELFSMVGSYIPFARTRSERERKKDPRPSVEERYKNRADYLQHVETAARNLVAGGYLLEQDVPKLVERGAAEWDRKP
ncbi:MAG TPA: alpha/beta hydrolase domain-containing protein [Bryobacteraceae bacterium]|nr:alpha/beta hydrolase domain-containing protein [Bryobacteraceae bacterium]